MLVTINICRHFFSVGSYKYLLLPKVGHISFFSFVADHKVVQIDTVRDLLGPNFY